MVIEDDPNISDVVAMYLRRDGFRVLQFGEGQAALERLKDESAHLVIVDIGLPGPLDGLDVCRVLRSDSRIPIVILTARDEEIDRILGLELGADDYVTKPFSPRELTARVHAILRRSYESPTSVAVGDIQIGDITLASRRREVRLPTGPIELTAKEFDLLSYFTQHRGIALSRRQLLDGVWGDAWIGDERTVDVHVRQLRKKFGNELPLITVWGFGYRLD